MIEVLIPTQSEFCVYEAPIKLLYEQSQEKICDTNSFEFIRDNTLFYLFVLDGVVLGAIYYFKYKNKLYLNGFSRRKSFLENIYCLYLSTTWFTCDIYAEAQNRASALCLLRCGFKRVNGKLFMLKRDWYYIKERKFYYVIWVHYWKG